MNPILPQHFLTFPSKNTGAIIPKICYSNYKYLKEKIMSSIYIAKHAKVANNILIQFRLGRCSVERRSGWRAGRRSLHWWEGLQGRRRRSGQGMQGRRSLLPSGVLQGRRRDPGGRLQGVRRCFRRGALQGAGAAPTRGGWGRRRRSIN